MSAKSAGRRIYRSMTVRIASLMAEIAAAERDYAPGVARIMVADLRRTIETVRERALAQMSAE